MNSEIKNQCYILALEGYPQKDIAKKLGLSEPTVSRAINSITKGNDYQLAVKGCSVLLQEFVKFQDFCRNKLRELSDLKNEKKTLLRNNNETGEIEAKEVELSPIDKLVIIKAQTEIYKDLLSIGSQGEFIESVQKIRGKISELENKS